MEEGKGERYLAPGRQYGNALLGVRHQEEECTMQVLVLGTALKANADSSVQSCMTTCRSTITVSWSREQ